MPKKKKATDSEKRERARKIRDQHKKQKPKMLMDGKSDLQDQDNYWKPD